MRVQVHPPAGWAPEGVIRKEDMVQMVNRLTVPNMNLGYPAELGGRCDPPLTSCSHAWCARSARPRVAHSAMQSCTCGAASLGKPDAVRAGRLRCLGSACPPHALAIRARRPGPEGPNAGLAEWHATLRSDCPQCPWWDDHRPVPPGDKERLQAALGPKLDGKGGRLELERFWDKGAPVVRVCARVGARVAAAAEARSRMGSSLAHARCPHSCCPPPRRS